MTALVLVELTGVSVIAPDPLGDTPDKVPIMVEVQLNEVPVMEEVGMKFSGVALQISWINDVDELVTTGLGLTVTITSIGVPVQTLACGVIL